MNAARTSRAKSWLEPVLGFLYPEVCQICEAERATAECGYVCHACAARVTVIAPPFCSCCGRPFPGQITGEFVCSQCEDTERYFVRARAAVVFDGVVQQAIHRFKYQQAKWFEPFLAGLLVAAAQPTLTGGGWDYLVPAPLHRLKLREREFNQAEVLAAWLSRACGIPLNTKLIERVENTPSQTQMTREERAANVRRAFAVQAGVSLAGARLVVVDDVMTTGATVNACARVLRKAGAAEVVVWTLARGM